jgi:hypothetical protein
MQKTHNNHFKKGASPIRLRILNSCSVLELIEHDNWVCVKN